MDSTALLGDVAQATTDPRAPFSARYRPDLLDDDGVVGELGSAHEGGRCSLGDRKDSAVLHLPYMRYRIKPDSSSGDRVRVRLGLGRVALCKVLAAAVLKTRPAP